MITVLLATAILVIAYLLGSIPSGLLIGRSHGVDVRQHGSGNIGATNVWRVLGKRPGLITFACDVGKGWLAVVLAFSLANRAPAAFGDPAYPGIVAAIGCILGHSFPVWLGFKGGKGVATSLGVIIGMMPLASVLTFGIWGLVFKATRYVSLASLVAAVALPVVVLALLFVGPSRPEWLELRGWGNFYFACAAALLVVIRHRENIQRLLAGTENRFGRATEDAEAADSPESETPDVRPESPQRAAIGEQTDSRAVSGKRGDRFDNVAILGAGSWGTALALLLHENGLTATVWGHERSHVEEVNVARENRAYLPGVALPPQLRFTSDLAGIRAADLIIVAIPSKAIREVAAQLATASVRDTAVLLSCTKGLERGRGLRMSEILHEFLPRNALAVLSGPSHAEEVARKMPTAVVIGCANRAVAEQLQQAFSTRFFRAYTSDDVAGIELGGALKNIFALAAGVSDGLGLGDNAKAALVTRSLAELIRVGTALGGRAETFQGLSGIGDLIVTCFSRHSRNRLVGERLGRGERLEAIVSSMQMVAEGVPTTYSVHECAHRLGIATPIIDQMRALLDGTCSPSDVLGNLLNREPRTEQ